MFAALGIAIACYTGFAAATGENVVSQGPGAQRVARAERPRYFWTCIAIYAALAMALMTIF